MQVQGTWSDDLARELGGRPLRLCDAAVVLPLAQVHARLGRPHELRHRGHQETQVSFQTAKQLSHAD